MNPFQPPSSQKALRIKLWGVRGSLPSPHTPEAMESHTRWLFNNFFSEGEKKASEVEKFLHSIPRFRFGGFGGNTPCLEVTSSKQQIIIDGGSGLRLLGNEMMRGPCGKGTGEVHILFTHFHWDHLIGLPFFVPLFVPGNQIHVYAVQPDLKDAFKTVFRRPYFPVALEDLGAKIHYHRLEGRKPISIGDIQLTPYLLDHPDPCWGFRFEKDGKSFSHCVDTECIRVTREQLGPDIGLYENADLMIFDGQYTLMESIEKVHWGHAAASLGLDIAMREKIKKVVFMHHDPASNDEKVAQAEKQARDYYESQLKGFRRSEGTLTEVDWEFAHEGMVLEV